MIEYNKWKKNLNIIFGRRCSIMEAILSLQSQTCSADNMEEGWLKSVCSKLQGRQICVLHCERRVTWPTNKKKTFSSRVSHHLSSSCVFIRGRLFYFTLTGKSPRQSNDEHWLPYAHRPCPSQWHPSALYCFTKPWKQFFSRFVISPPRPRLDYYIFHGIFNVRTARTFI